MSVPAATSLRDVAPKPFGIRRVSAVKGFAGLGVLFLAFQAYVYLRWLLSGTATATPTGADPVPTFMRVSADLIQGIGIIVFAFFVYRWVIRPLRREGQVSFYGLLGLAMLTLEWQDLLANYFRPIYTYNSTLFNLGSWYGFIPGWHSAGGHTLAEPILLVIPMWVYGMLGGSLIAATGMRLARRRWPSLHAIPVVLLGFAAGATFDVLLELTFARLGMYAFTGTIPSLTVFEGHYYQFPIYEPLTMGALFTVFGSLIYFRDDRGDTYAERGIRRLRAGNQHRAVVRFLAFTGFLNAFTVLYAVVFASFAFFPGFQWSHDIAHGRSYLRDQICGAGTERACPGDPFSRPPR